MRILFSLLHRDNPRLARRSAEALGSLARDLVETEPEKVREILRRLLWGMNDESGSLIRLAPLALTEILVKLPAWLPEFGPLLASYDNTEPFVSDVFWAMARLSPIQPDLFQPYLVNLQVALASSDPAVRAYSAQTLFQLHFTFSPEQIYTLREDNSLFEAYNLQMGDFYTCSVSEYLKTLRTEDQSIPM